MGGEYEAGEHAANASAITQRIGGTRDGGYHVRSRSVTVYLMRAGAVG